MANKKLPKIDHNTYAADIRDLLELRIAKKAADKLSRELDMKLSHARVKLLGAMDGQPSVVCGNIILTFREGRVDPGALTLHSGVKVPLSDVSGIVVRNQDCIPVDEVKTWFGGRIGGVDIDVAGEV